MAMVECPNCHRYIGDAYHQCPYCAFVVRPIEKNEKPLVNCPMCGKLIPEDSKSCPYCKYTVVRKFSYKKVMLVSVIAAVVVLSVLGVSLISRISASGNGIRISANQITDSASEFLSQLSFTNANIQTETLNDIVAVDIKNTTHKALTGTVGAYIYYKEKLVGHTVIYLPQDGIRAGETMTLTGSISSVKGRYDSIKFIPEKLYTPTQPSAYH